MATPKQPPASKPPPAKPTYTEALGDAIARFNSALEAFNTWNQGYREVWLELINSARQMRACGVSLPWMPGEQQMQAGAPGAHTVGRNVDVDAELRSAIKQTGVVDVAGVPVAPAAPVTGGPGTPKTS